jgi:hypothetical protein
VRLACFAITVGVTDYHGPEMERRRRKKTSSAEAAQLTS